MVAGVEIDEVMVIASLTPTEVRAWESPSATALTNGLPAKASRLDGQDAVGVPGHSKGDHKMKIKQSASIGSATNQPTSPERGVWAGRGQHEL